MHEELRYQLALTKIPQIGVVLARTLLEKFGSAREIFYAKRSQLEHTEGMGTVRTLEIKKFRDFDRVEKEMGFLETYRIRALCITDEAYPSRLRHCYDPPTLLFCKGVADLNAERMLAVVGTRTHTEYGKWITESLIRSLQEYHVTIISGMAFGIDACAHRSALKHQLPTIGALAHGLAYLYPPSHKKLAAEIIASSGALITEYWSDQAPDKHLFPARNRVVAGLCDALVVTESGIKGGSMLTAELASGYHKELFAFPGRSTDSKSEGCNLLIKANKAQLVCGPEDVAEIMGWKQKSDLRPRVQRMIPFTLNDEEKKVMEAFATQSLHHIDQLRIATNLPMGVLSAILLELEMKGCIRSLPGKTYCSNL